MDNKKGISLISLIITIIVIIILAAIVIFNGFGATESAQFAKFSQEYSSYGEEIQQRYLDAKVKSSLRGESKRDSEIYAEIASTLELQIADVLDGKALSEDLDGTLCYKLSEYRTFYQGDSGTYITDKGEIFTLPGYRYSINGEERRYVNARKYYLGDGTALSGENTGEPVEMTGAPTVDGIIAVGDYVEYTPDVATYTNNEVPAGKLSGDYYLGHNDSRTLTTDTETKWIVVRINDGAGENGEILITPENAVNSLKLQGGPGYLNSVRVLDYVCGKLYSNRELGTKARSMRAEDLDYKETGATTRYAYYVNGVEDMPATITVNGKMYTCKEHRSTSNYRFWEYDEETSGECIKTYTIIVAGEPYTYSCAMPVGNKPVLVTYKTMSRGLKYNGAIGKIGNRYGWLASPFAYLYSEYARFNVIKAYSPSVSGVFGHERHPLGVLIWASRAVATLVCAL